MKTLIISSLAAATIALSSGAALADRSTDIDSETAAFRSVQTAPAAAAKRSFYSGNAAVIVYGDNVPDSERADFRSVQSASTAGKRVFYSGAVAVVPVYSDNVPDSERADFRSVQGR
jgi:uncharacterized protein YbaA (DUF1428 family)